MSSNPKVRVEDVLTLLVVGGMLLFARTRAGLLQIEITAEAWWELALIFFPLSVLVFVAALRYAFGRRDRPAIDTTMRRIGTVVRDWLPFGVFIIVYEAFQSRLWKSVLGPDRDAQLLAIDRRWFGETPAVTLQHYMLPWLTDGLAVAYFLHIVLPAVLALALYRSNLREFRALLLGVFLAGAIGSAGYLLVPAVGPAIAYPELFTVPLEGQFQESVLGMIDLARAPRDVFPSLHVGISAIVLWYAFRRSRGWGLAFLPLVLGNWAATIYLRYHYFVDVVAGFAVAVVALLLTEALLAIERRGTARQSAEE